MFYIYYRGEKMKQSFKDLTEAFKIIASKKWIPSSYKSHGSIGLTFEKELNKNADSLYFPDFQDIEIKCTSAFSRYPLYLFTVAFDGPTFPEIERIVEKYGYLDNDFPDKNVLFETINCQTLHYVNKQFKFKLEVDETEDKLYLCVFDLQDKLLERSSFVYLSTIRHHLLVKLQYLAIIHAYQKKEKQNRFFRYYQLDLYELTSFENFLELLKRGRIDVDIIARINKSGEDKGRYRNKNLVFKIKKDRIEQLFHKVYHINYDKEKEE